MEPKIATLRKSKPWYTAGKEFGFKGAGLGIDEHYFHSDYDIIQFLVKGKKPYYISINQADRIITTYNSWIIVRGQKVGIIPFSECKPTLYEAMMINEINKEEAKVLNLGL